MYVCFVEGFLIVSNGPSWEIKFIFFAIKFEKCCFCEININQMALNRINLLYMECDCENYNGLLHRNVQKGLMIKMTGLHIKMHVNRLVN